MKAFLATAALVLVSVASLAAPVSAAGFSHITSHVNTTSVVKNKTTVNVTNTSHQTGNGTNTNTSTFTLNGVPVISPFSFSSCTQTSTVNGVTTTTSC